MLILDEKTLSIPCRYGYRDRRQVEPLAALFAVELIELECDPLEEAFPPGIGDVEGVLDMLQVAAKSHRATSGISSAIAYRA